MNPEEPKVKKGGRRIGAGRPSLIRANKLLIENGIDPVSNNLTKPVSKAILPVSAKARHQEILAGMLNKKGKAVIQKILDKALNDEDKDQMACLKIVADRIIPADYLTKASGKSNQINISITGIGQVEATTEVYDMEEVEED